MKLKIYKSLTILYSFLFLFLMIYFLITKTYNKNTSTTSDNSSNTYFSDQYDRLDDVLGNLNYNYIYTYDNFTSVYFSFAQYDSNSNNFSINEYMINNNDSITLSVTENSFIISLPGIDTWTISNYDSLNNIILEHTSTILDWKNSVSDPYNYLGMLYHRDNFYFSINSLQSETLTFEYADGFILNINIISN